MSESSEVPQSSIPESQERLRSPNKIFFHTTPSQNVPSLVEDGLISAKNRDIIGRDLLYSVTFGKEFNIPTVRRNIKSKGDVTDFSLTVWKASPDIQQVKRFGRSV